MPNLIKRLRWVFNPHVIKPDDIVMEALAAITQGYLEEDLAKFRSGALMLNTVKSVDRGKVFLDVFLKAIEETWDIYDITEEQSEEILKRITEADETFQLEAKLVYNIHEARAKAKIKKEKGEK